MNKNIAILVGSLRKESFTRKIANALINLAPAQLTCKIIPIHNLSFFNQDEESDPPKEWIVFRDEIKKSHAFILATPEYNRSIPGVLKNAIDIGSRPYGQSAWDRKPCAIISVSPGKTGGFGANHHLRQCLVFLNAPCMQQPEAYLGNVSSILNDEGNISDDSTKAFLKKYMESFGLWVDSFIKP
jgi:chromate reductase, NAD(P)H dehydrogenase (quinone)